MISSLQVQSYPRGQFEILLIDNASRPSIRSWLAPELLSWVHLHEERELGLVHARKAGLHNAKGELILFVDDDNLLAPNYLEIAWEIGRRHPQLGVWGGQIRGEFETAPAAWTEKYVGFLGLREFTQEVTSTTFTSPQFSPIGAGMCVRRPVLQRYIRTCDADPRHFILGRKGRSDGGSAHPLMACEDFDICWEATEMGLTIGLFPQLVLTHLIPAVRLQEPYLLRIVEGIWTSRCVFEYLRLGKVQTPLRSDLSARFTDWLRGIFVGSRERRFQRAYRAGFRRADEWITANATAPSDAPELKRSAPG